MTNSIEVKNISKDYGRFKLNNISMNVPVGSIVGIVGENGAGKSTLLKIILGLRKPDSGTVELLGQDLSNGISDNVKENIGVVFDESCYPENFTVNMTDKFMKMTYKNWNSELFFRLAQKFNLPSDDKFEKYSKGMKMKLSIATALSHKASLLILDEATSGLDPFIRDELIDILFDYTRDEDNTILFSSHIITDLEKLCDYIAFINKGNLVLFEEKDAIVEKYGIVKCTKEEAEKLPKDSLVSVKEGKYSCEALVLRNKSIDNKLIEKSSLEEIIIFLSKEEKYESITL